MANDKIAEVGVNLSEKATLIWNIADILRGPFKPSEYGKVTLPMIEVVNETEDGYGTQCSGVTIGKAGHFIDHFARALQEKRDPLHKLLHSAMRKYTAKRLCGFIDRISKGIEEEHADGSENATEGGKSSENNDNE